MYIKYFITYFSKKSKLRLWITANCYCEELTCFCHSRESGNPGGSGKDVCINKIKKAHIYYVYILASQRNGTLYIGVTNDLFNRSFQHKLKQDSQSFTAKYKIDKLVYFEEYQYIQDAILREKQLKKWNRQWKIKLIEKDNTTWRDLFLDML